MPDAETAGQPGALRAPGAAAGVSVAGAAGGAWAVAGEATLLAFDFGLRKLGVGLGNTITGSATPLEIIRSQTRDERFQRIATLIEEWRPASLIVGLSLDENGAEQHASLQGRRFANQLHGRFGLPVILVDERGSSMEAQRRLGTNADDDAVAAAIILERYLDLLSRAVATSCNTASVPGSRTAS
ncbi:putative Holliday junction resolvase [Kerstersia gyiorum]|nr:putative Holliday junction resolvase [Kerstersia gyiorum]MCP1681631.1 putative Holliday junction resolvase [Kerstersia gyiorum]MCP1717298.1 putative Holliday junction resolvase [Kerstersia gyiorum]MCW2186000.1 putative Holliday junction resolvase [Kerstersia gyiorum]